MLSFWCVKLHQYILHKKICPKMKVNPKLTLITSLKAVKPVRLGIEDKKILWAARHNDLKQLNLALALGANVNVCKENLETPLYIASENGFVELVEILVKQDNIRLNDRTLFGNTALGRAAMLPEMYVLKVLLQAGADVNQSEIFSKTPLHVAVFHSNIECAKVLLTNKANPNAVDCFDQTPLYLSIITNPYPTMTKLLLKVGANPNFKFKNQMSLLSVAILHATNVKHLRAISYLIRYGANISETDIKNETALHKAALRGYAPIIHFLVKHGADIHAKNIYRQKPYDVAILHKNYETANELKVLEEKEENEEISRLLRSL